MRAARGVCALGLALLTAGCGSNTEVRKVGLPVEGGYANFRLYFMSTGAKPTSQLESFQGGSVRDAVVTVLTRRPLDKTWTTYLPMLQAKEIKVTTRVQLIVGIATVAVIVLIDLVTTAKGGSHGQALSSFSFSHTNSGGFNGVYDKDVAFH